MTNKLLTPHSCVLTFSFVTIVLWVSQMSVGKRILNNRVFYNTSFIFYLIFQSFLTTPKVEMVNE